jgi:hypothetical protein
VRPDEIVRFSAYELAFLLAPGVLLYRALAGRRGSAIREIAIGWALGHVVEILAFSFTAAIGHRSWFVAYPVLVCAGSALVIRQHRGEDHILDAGESLNRSIGLTLAAILGVTFGYIAIVYFAQTPLPAPRLLGGYVPDITFGLDISGNALHHWPLRSAELAGVPLPYENFLYLHVAAVAQVTGIGVPVVLLRLYLLPLLVLFAIQLTWAGRALTGDRWSGVLATGLLLLIGEVNLSPRDQTGSVIHFLLATAFSPSFTFGLILFVPSVVLLAEHADVIPSPARERRWLVIALMLIGCSGAKGAILPVLVGGLILYSAWRAVRDRALDLAAARALALTAGLLALSYAVLYSGQSEGLRLYLHGTAAGIPRLARLLSPLDRIPGLSTPLWLIANGVEVVVFAAAPLGGLLWLVNHRGAVAPRATALLLGILAAGLIPFFILFAPGFANVWFTYYGCVAGALLSATGLRLFWGWWRSRAVVERSGGLALAVAIACGALLAAYLGSVLHASDGIADGASVAVVVAVGAALYASLRISPRHGRRLMAAAMLPIFVLGVLDIPIHVGPELVERGSEPAYANSWGTVQPGLVASLDWLRSHTSPGAVVAVNNYYITHDGQRIAEDMEYSALSERSIYLEGWTEATDILGRSLSGTFSRRLALNNAVFQRVDSSALAQLVSAGVRYLLVDAVDGTASRNVDQLGRLVYANRVSAIYAVSQSARSHR